MRIPDRYQLRIAEAIVVMVIVAGLSAIIVYCGSSTNCLRIRDRPATAIAPVNRPRYRLTAKSSLSPPVVHWQAENLS
jgi:hypothetical protein